MLKSLNDISPKIFEEINRLASLFFTPKEVAIMLEIDVQLMLRECSNENSEIFKQFEGGRYQGEIDVRTGILKMAKAGSSQAQTMALDLLKSSKQKMRD